MFFFKYILGIKPRYTPKPLRMGSAFSDSLEAWNSNAANRHYVELLEGAQTAGNEDYFEDLKSELTAVQVMAESYMGRYEKPEQREVEFDLPIPGTSYRDRGRIDFIQDGSLGEDKFLARWWDRMETGLRFDHQVTAMLRAAREAGIPADGLWYRVTIKPRDRRRKRNPESLAEYREWIVADVDANPEKYFFQKFEQRTDRQLDDFGNELVEAALELERRTEREYFPQYLQSCNLHKDGCPYFRLCADDLVGDEFSTLFTQPEEREVA